MDPIAEALEATEQMEAARLARREASARRRAAINTARATMSAQQIADQLGISKARVYAIAAGRE